MSWANPTIHFDILYTEKLKLLTKIESLGLEGNLTHRMEWLNYGEVVLALWSGYLGEKV